MDRRKALYSIVVVFVLSFGVSMASVSANPDIAFSDGFENQNFDLWDGNGATNWLIGTYGSGLGGSADPHTGDYDAYSCYGQIGELNSDDIDLLGVSSATLSFWFQTDDTEPADIYLYLYDGSIYNLIGTIDTGVDDSWFYYSINITNTYWVSNFRIQFLSAINSNKENVWIDDVLVEYTVAGQNYVADVSQSVSSTQSIVTKTDYVILPSQSLTTTWAILTQWNIIADLIQSITSSWSVVSSLNMFVTLSQGINSAWQIVTEWDAIIELTQALSHSWDILTEWDILIDLTQTLSCSWGVLIQTTFNTIVSLSSTFTWIVDVVHSISGGVQHIVELTQAVSTSWIVDAFKGIQLSVSLTATITTSWIVDNLYSPVSARVSTNIIQAQNVLIALIPFTVLTMIISDIQSGEFGSGTAWKSITLIAILGALAYLIRGWGY